jgi:hypothetical protein
MIAELLKGAGIDGKLNQSFQYAKELENGR